MRWKQKNAFVQDLRIAGGPSAKVKACLQIEVWCLFGCNLYLDTACRICEHQVALEQWFAMLHAACLHDMQADTGHWTLDTGRTLD